MNASLFYEVLIYLNSFYFGMYAMCEFGIAIFKYAKIPYSEDVMYSEFGLLCGMTILESLRIYLGRKGNLSERAFPVIVSMILIFPSAAAVCYFLALQQTVLNFEKILSAFQLVLHGTELLFALLSFIPGAKNHEF